ncbi:MAG: TonB-dependent receptor [Prevotellaceae bacterium]|jgi:TonB-linked SusC/RagA family outer membrane protein|nr:TonB-dependent receptor [Prevotellaceae bacterium]
MADFYTQRLKKGVAIIRLSRAKALKYFGGALLPCSIFIFFTLSLGLAPLCALEIKGTVLDKRTGKPVVGVTVLIPSTTSGAGTDASGNFTLQTSASLPVVLAFSLMGYAPQEVEVHDVGAPLRVLLAEDVSYIDEVVVVGYGTQKRRELTGAVASVSKAVLEHPGASLDRLLGGAVAGVSVSQLSGQPGTGASIRIRGGNSITASNDPLYVIDGFIFYSDASSTKTGVGNIEGSLNPLAAINPSDIESIEVLKDVSATAIYGSRGANGVILVTTKKGARSADNVSYQYSIGWDTPAKKLDLLNATQWARMQKDFFLNKGRYTDEEIAQLGSGYDWQSAVLQTGVSQTHELSLSGGNDQLRYRLSGSYADQSGIVLNSGFERYNGRVNIDKSLAGDKLTVGVAATAGKSTQNSLTAFEEVNYNSSPYSRGIANSLTYALYMPPVVPIYAENGDYCYDNPFEYSYLMRDGITANPVSDLNNSTGQTINTTLLGNAYARYSIINGLTAKVSAGTYMSYVTQNFFAPSYTALGLEKMGLGAIGNKRQTVSQAEYTLTYTKQLNANHLIDLLGGYTYQHTQANYNVNLTSHFTNEDLGENNLADGASPYAPVSGMSKSDLHSLLGRLNYTLLGRYNLTATIRGDKSSRFAKNHRWGYFPSLGLSWNVDEEAFLKTVDALNALKLRLTYGTVGNQEIGDYEYAQTFAASRYNGATAYSQTNLGNKNLKWETTTQYNAGLDAELLNRRVALVADVYRKETSDLLLEVPLNPTLGTVQLVNVGSVTNQGVELALNVTLIKRQKLTWSVAANAARNVNTIVGMGANDRIILGQSEEQVLQVGEPLGTFFGLVFDGIVQAGEDVAKLPATPYGVARPGDLKMADAGGQNGVPDNAINTYDRVPLGSLQPEFTCGLQTSLDYRGFDLFVSWQGAQGNKVYNHLRRYLESPNDSYNASAALLNSWTAEKPSNSLPGLANAAADRIYGYLDSRYVEDASFLRLKNITLGYTTKLPLVASGLLRLFVSAQNLLVITAYKGYDPEVAKGVDLGAYPTAKTFSGGIKITF